MKITLRTLILCSLLFSTLSAYSDNDVKKLISRTSEGNIKKVKLKKIKSDKTEFEHYVKDGTLYITGSDDVALSRGYYDFVKH